MLNKTIFVSYILMMKNFLSYLLVLILIVASFYYADKISSLVINKSSLMKEINNKKSNYEKEYVNAVITDNYIVPGVNGLKVNVLESYYNMKRENLFQKDKIVFNEIVPEVSLEQNKKYIINKANYIKGGVAILIYNNEEVLKSIDKLDITRLVDTNLFSKKSIFEQINYDKNNFEKVDKLLKDNNLNKEICIVENNIDKYCLNNNYYLVKPTYNINNSNIYLKENISSGDIIFIDDNLSLSNFKLLLISLKYHDLKVYSLSKLISEKK